MKDNAVHVSVYDPLQGYWTEDMLRQALDDFSHEFGLMDGNTGIQDNIACFRLPFLCDLTYMPNADDNTERIGWMNTYRKDIKRFNINKIKEGQVYDYCSARNGSGSHHHPQEC